MCIKNHVILLRPIFDTTYKGEIWVKIYMWALHHKLVLFQQSRNVFRYVPENDIEEYILGWTTSVDVWVKCVVSACNNLWSNPLIQIMWSLHVIFWKVSSRLKSKSVKDTNQGVRILPTHHFKVLSHKIMVLLALCRMKHTYTHTCRLVSL